MSNRKSNEFEGDFDHSKAWQSESVAGRYDQKRFTSWGGRAFDSMEKRSISALLDGAQADDGVNNVLELACGTGRISELLASRGFKLTCGDISEEMLDAAKQRLHGLPNVQVDFTTLDIYNLSQYDSQFDCVCCFRLFQHLTTEERSKALREMAKTTKRYVLVNVMYTSAYYGLLRKVRKALGRYITRYTSSDEEITRELEYAGLRKVAQKLSQPGFNGNLILLLEKK